MAVIGIVALVLAGCGSSSSPKRPAHRKPTCSKLLQSARHELGDTSSEIRRHCNR